MTIGIFGGSFNPIHLGHLIVARDVLETLGLSEILFVPAGRPWMKAPAELAEPEDRARMVELGIEGDAGFRSSRREVGREGDTYTIDTLRELDDGPSRPVLIVGADAMESFPSWREAAEVAARARVVVVGRPDRDLQAIVAEAQTRVPELEATVLQAPLVEVSGTEIRKRIREGKTIRNLVPAAVERYINARRLYRSVGDAAGRRRGARNDHRLARLKEIEEEKAILRGSFTLRSGKTSRYYFDGRKATYDPEGAALIGALVEELVEDGVQAIGGPSTAASPIITAAQLAAHQRGRRIEGFYVRGEAKGHGTKRLIEGNLPAKGGAVVVVDDTMTTGGSLIHTIEAVEAEGCSVARVVVVVDRGEGGGEALRGKGYDLVALLTADAEGNLS